MADKQNDGTKARALRTGRMEAFSDGVFAIAITLLVLEIGVPEGSGDDLWGALLDQWSSYLAYLVSFATIGAVWFAHTVITEALSGATSVLIRVNLLLLLVVAFLPFPTILLSEYVGEPDAERIAVTVYGLNLLLASVLVSTLWRYANRAGLVREDLTDREVRALSSRLTPSLVSYAVVIVLGIFLPVVAVLGYLLIAIYLLLPLRELLRQYIHSGQER
ncbi:MAG TPA: TMEM175 family protein [Actinomycetes bacterium]|nr:TMEM175 family protein [Actinomycetes bacterium]